MPAPTTRSITRSEEEGGTGMADDLRLVTRTVMCPRCRADATLSYVMASTSDEKGRADNVVYLCPNMCTFAQDEVTALLDRDA